MASYRHLARTCLMQTLFAVEFKKSGVEVDAKKILDKILDEFAPKLTEKEFAHETLDGLLQHNQEILQLIQRFAPQWPVDKIAKVDRAILEIGTYEIIFSHDVPPVVAINEAIEMAKQFGDENSSKFVNGVLSSIMKNHNK